LEIEAEFGERYFAMRDRWPLYATTRMRLKTCH